MFNNTNHTSLVCKTPQGLVTAIFFKVVCHNSSPNPSSSHVTVLTNEICVVLAQQTISLCQLTVLTPAHWLQLALKQQLAPWSAEVLLIELSMCRISVLECARWLHKHRYCFRLLLLQLSAKRFTQLHKMLSCARHGCTKWMLWHRLHAGRTGTAAVTTSRRDQGTPALAEWAELDAQPAILGRPGAAIVPAGLVSGCTAPAQGPRQLGRQGLTPFARQFAAQGATDWECRCAHRTRYYMYTSPG